MHYFSESEYCQVLRYPPTRPSAKWNFGSPLVSVVNCSYHVIHIPSCIAYFLCFITLPYVPLWDLGAWIFTWGRIIATVNNWTLIRCRVCSVLVQKSWFSWRRRPISCFRHTRRMICASGALVWERPATASFSSSVRRSRGFWWRHLWRISSRWPLPCGTWWAPPVGPWMACLSIRMSSTLVFTHFVCFSCYQCPFNHYEDLYSAIQGY